MGVANPHMSVRRTIADQSPLVAWRRRRLIEAGFEPALAAELAADLDADLHALLDLVDRGCPPALAARILAPLDPPGPWAA